MAQLVTSNASDAAAPLLASTLLVWYKPLAALLLSLLGACVTAVLIPQLAPLFITARLSGVDMSKRVTAASQRPLPEAMGAVSGVVYLLVIFLVMPIVFGECLVDSNSGSGFPYRELYVFTSAPLTVCCMLLLGFADDVLNLRWRYKLVLPLISSIQLLMTYAMTGGSTTVVVPWPLRGYLGLSLDIGLLYYAYMAMLGIFCTNAINILAGINGLEVGQSLLLALSILMHNCIELGGAFWPGHVISVYFLLPYVCVTLPLFYFNWYPSRVFVGDTFCYFSGMLFAVVAIQGHFSKTLLLLSLPQLLNFVYSLPQLFHLIPCPRHRLPRYDATSDLMHMSCTELRPESLSTLGRLVLRALLLLRLVHRHTASHDTKKDWLQINNLTLINAWLRVRGPLHERRLTCELLFLQTLCAVMALWIRYPVANFFYST